MKGIELAFNRNFKIKIAYEKEYLILGGKYINYIHVGWLMIWFTSDYSPNKAQKAKTK